MAVSLKDPHDGDIAEISDINVTPFIDVILVLLIIFMVAAPLSTVDVPVELPVSNAQPQPRPDKPVFLTIKSDLSLAIGDDPAPRETLQTVLDQHTGHDREQRIFLRTDSTPLPLTDERDEPPPRRRLPEDRVGRTGRLRQIEWRG